MEKTLLSVFDKIDASVDPQNIEAYHRLKFDDNDQSNKVSVKFSKHKVMAGVMNTKKSLKNANLNGTGLPQALHCLLILVFIKLSSLILVYKYLWPQCKAKLVTNILILGIKWPLIYTNKVER